MNLTHPIASELSIHWEVISNITPFKNTFLFKLIILNSGDLPLSASGWTLYFNFSRVILKKENEPSFLKYGIHLKHLSGDLYEITPLEPFQPILSGKSITLPFYAKGCCIARCDAPQGFHITFEASINNRSAHAVPLTVGSFERQEQTLRFPEDQIPVENATIRFKRNESDLKMGPSLLFDFPSLKDQVVPEPFKVIKGKEDVELDAMDGIYVEKGLENEAFFLNQVLEERFHLQKKQIHAMDPSLMESGHKNGIFLCWRLSKKDETYEAYELNLNKADNAITIHGKARAGVFYAIQTLSQLIPNRYYRMAALGRPALGIKLPEAKIMDHPRFSYRGVHLDVVRHFKSVGTVKKMLDLMAFFKLNRFHFHLTNDEGWRLEIPGLSELTELGAQRSFDAQRHHTLPISLGSGNQQSLGSDPLFHAGDDHILGKEKLPDDDLNFQGAGSGYYTPQEFVDILRYAAIRHITVIPEIVFPGHARAAIKAMAYRQKKMNGDDIYQLEDSSDPSCYTSVQMYSDNVVNPCLKSTHTFLKHVIKEITAMYQTAKAPLDIIHLGGDEVPEGVWKSSPKCKSFMKEKGFKNTHDVKRDFFKRAAKMVQTVSGARLGGWDDVVLPNGSAEPSDYLVKDGFIPYVWQNTLGSGLEDAAYQMANKGYDVILSCATHLYFDMLTHKDPDEIGLYWASFVDTKKVYSFNPFDILDGADKGTMGEHYDAGFWKDKAVLTESGKKHILGIQACLWGETTKTDHILESQAFPRVLALSERAWNRNMPERENLSDAYARFANKLGRFILPMLDYYPATGAFNHLANKRGVHYRLPLPGAKIVGGKLMANLSLPGIKMVYSFDGGTSWEEYDSEKPPLVQNEVATQLRSYIEMVEQGKVVRRYSRTIDLGKKENK